MADEVKIRELFAAQRTGVLVTLKRDGRPQLSNVRYAYDPARELIRVSITADRVKAKNLARDPRASLYATSPDYGTWAVAEGTAELTPVAAAEDDATVEELVDLYRTLSGEHPDWDEYRAAMVRDRRLVVELHVEHLYGQTP
ncbi:PPOX class F420-dependent oxidoreductase [Kitasatospora sp. GAS204B]|uniref:PPOX class F420-dependent oxidoreductase n=1 Tax=unclassified Kitasatospora TaxID=2633591 RepID=UPI002473BB02|nr:PPOX class F420-dependent oxidoreductase [Kitasatospora sp. GAS204B]MDH6119053.1 PPOX class probable F420-dependent enzyme [Kitasatospora sp. GAS204B]